MRESALPGLNAWMRVADYRLNDLRQRGNVQIFTQSALSKDDVLELGTPNVFVATGSRWRADGIGRNTLRTPPQIDDQAVVLTPDDVMAGAQVPDGPVVIYDDDHAYIAGVLAEKLARDGHKVTFVTPESRVSCFTELTLEQHRIQARLLELGVNIICNHTLSALEAEKMQIACGFTGRTQDIGCKSALLVTERRRETALYDALVDQGLTTLELIGDAAGPALIADAVYAGHMAARNFERAKADVDQDWFRRELISLTEEGTK